MGQVLIVRVAKLMDSHHAQPEDKIAEKIKRPSQQRPVCEYVSEHTLLLEIEYSSYENDLRGRINKL